MHMKDIRKIGFGVCAGCVGLGAMMMLLHVWGAIDLSVSGAKLFWTCFVIFCAAMMLGGAAALWFKDDPEKKS